MTHQTAPQRASKAGTLGGKPSAQLAPSHPYDAQVITRALCACGDAVWVHKWMPKTKTLPAGNRGSCSAQGPDGRCKCPSPR